MSTKQGLKIKEKYINYEGNKEVVLKMRLYVQRNEKHFHRLTLLTKGNWINTLYIIIILMLDDLFVSEIFEKISSRF